MTNQAAYTEPASTLLLYCRAWASRIEACMRRRAREGMQHAAAASFAAGRTCSGGSSVRSWAHEQRRRQRVPLLQGAEA